MSLKISQRKAHEPPASRPKATPKKPEVPRRGGSPLKESVKISDEATALAQRVGVKESAKAQIVARAFNDDDEGVARAMRSMGWVDRAEAGSDGPRAMKPDSSGPPRAAPPEAERPQRNSSGPPRAAPPEPERPRGNSSGPPRAAPPPRLESPPTQGGPEGPPGETRRQDPLVLDLNGDGQINLTTQAEGIRFDINHDGFADRMASVAQGDAFLAMDRDGDGRITNGAELFGDVTGAEDGFADLARLDENEDGVIDAHDRAFEELLLFDGEETRSLSDAGVASISLEHEEVDVEREDGNAVTANGGFTRSDGSVGRVSDVLLAYRTIKGGE